MTKDELLKILREQIQNDDCEAAHLLADDALIEYINDAEIAEAYEEIGKWYS